MSSINTNAGLQDGIISFVFIALGDHVGLDADTVGVSTVSEIAFTGDSVEGFVDTAGSAGIENPEISFLAVALAVLEISVDSTVLVARALSIDDSVSSVTDTAFSIFIPVTVERADLGDSAFSFVDGHSIIADAFSVDVS